MTEFPFIFLVQGRERTTEEHLEDGVRRSPIRRQSHPQTFSFYNTNSEGSSDGSESEYEEDGEQASDGEEEADEDPIDEVPESYEFETEAQKRTERRHAKATREREGQRRRREGLRRNYLLVDEYTKRPYGVGVND